MNYMFFVPLIILKFNFFLKILFFDLKNKKQGDILSFDLSHPKGGLDDIKQIDYL